MPYYTLYIATEYTQLTLEITPDSLRLVTLDTTLHMQNVLGLQIHRLPEMILSLPPIPEVWWDKVADAFTHLLLQMKDKNLHHCVYTLYLHTDVATLLIDSGN